MTNPYTLRIGIMAFALSLTLFFLAVGGNAYASNSYVVIANGTTSHCMPYLSCYKPYEIDIMPGDTVTWINEDNQSHTATAGTTNNGPVGLFDTGLIPPGKSYTQFFGKAGKYPYYDQVDMWPSGIVVVSNQNPSNAEIGWVNNTLSLTSLGENGSQKLEITKQIENTGGTDASSVILRLRILIDSGFLFYDNIQKGSVPANQIRSVSFTWNHPQDGNYRLSFDAENLDRHSNEIIGVSSDLISVSKSGPNHLQTITAPRFAINNGSTPVPEFGQLSHVILLVSIISFVGISSLCRHLFK